MIHTKIKQSIESATKIVITSHKSPDGDSIGSSLGLYLLCKELGKDVVICHPDPAQNYLDWVPSVEVILNYEQHQHQVLSCFNDADLIFSLDYNDPSRIGDQMGQLLVNSSAIKVMIDHHLNPAEFVDLMLSETDACSTCQLVFDLIEFGQLTSFLTKEIGVCLYLGIMTDTGSFRFPSVKPRTHQVCAQILSLDIDHALIHENLNDVNTLTRLRLRGYACDKKLIVNDAFKVAYITLTKKELLEYNHKKGDTEGLVNIALSILGMRMAVLWVEHEDYVKISFRSKGLDNPVNLLASSYFNGGGHANASGGRFDGSLEDALALFFKVLPEFR